jgi:hypothetical protein
MDRNSIMLLMFLVGLTGCVDTKPQIDKLQIAKQYYQALDQSDGSTMRGLLTDSLVTAIPAYDYEQVFLSDDYIGNWLKWDSVFEPTYEILEIDLVNGSVKATISKRDKRILFLLEEPFQTIETLRFRNNQIARVETEYVNFKEALWEKNKNELLEWITVNHPELDGFIYDQTESGGMKFLKAIELYQSQD